MTPTRRQAALGRIRLRHLQCFLAVVQSGNLRRAADALAITQPAVTKTIAELEALLGTALFVRGRHGATPTADALAFLRHATASVQALGAAVDSVLLPSPEPAPLRLGVLPTVAPACCGRSSWSRATRRGASSPRCGRRRRPGAPPQRRRQPRSITRGDRSARQISIAAPRAGP